MSRSCTCFAFGCFWSAFPCDVHVALRFVVS